MTWAIGDRVVGRATGAKVTGQALLGGARFTFTVSLELVAWPGWQKEPAEPLSILMRPTEVCMCTQRGNVHAGLAHPIFPDVVVPLSHSTGTTVGYDLELASSALCALEESRNGGPLQVEMYLGGLAFTPARQQPLNPERFSFAVPREEWLAAVSTAGFKHTLLFELSLGAQGDGPAAEAGHRLAQAFHERGHGSYANTLRQCRVALDALEQGGFGGNAPTDVAQFLQRNARNLSMAERYSALLAALKLYLSPAHHPNSPDSEYTRDDADLALAMVAALAKLAPLRGKPNTGTDADGEGT